MNNIFFIVVAFAMIIYIFISVRQEKLSVQSSFGWIIASILMLILAIFPKSLDWVASSLGIEYPPAFFLTLCVVLLFAISFSYGKKIANLQAKITDLTQEINILKFGKNGKKK